MEWKIVQHQEKTYPVNASALSIAPLRMTSQSVEFWKLYWHHALMLSNWTPPPIGASHFPEAVPGGQKYNRIYRNE